MHCRHELVSPFSGFNDLLVFSVQLAELLMTYTVSSGTLNLTLLRLVMFCAQA